MEKRDKKGRLWRLVCPADPVFCPFGFYEVFVFGAGLRKELRKMELAYRALHGPSCGKVDPKGCL